MAGRTIDQGVSMLTAGEIRVAVLPVGPVPRDILDEYLELINRYHHVSLSATRSFYRESPLAQQAAAAPGGKAPFQFMDWSNSYMHLRFLQAEDARRRTRLADLHPGRQVLAILGVVYCPMCTSVQQAYDEFKKICRMYPEAFVARCFVFEPSEDHIRQERECQQLSDLVMFPPGGPTHLEQHLEVWMHDLAAALLTEFENWMLSATPALMKLNGYADSAEFTGASAVLDEMQKRLAAVDGESREKQRWGRLMKMKGDMCLLSGSPRDAAEHYRTAQEIAKSCSDWVWYGAALEGIATSRLHEVITGGAGISASEGGGGGTSSGGRSKQSLGRGRDGGRAGGPGYMTATKWDLVRRSDTESLTRECFTEARAAYKKRGGAAALQVEQHLKLCRLVAGLRGQAARREVGELVTSVSDLLPSLPSAEDRIVAIVECAQVLGMVGCHRKRTLLLWHAMETARAVGTDKGDLLRIAVRALEPPDDPQTQDPDDLPRVHWSVRRALSRSSPGASCGWEAVHTVVLEAALAAAKQAHAPAEAWEAAASLLRDHHLVLAPQYQAALMETLSQASAALPNRQRTRPGLGPGPLVQCKRLLPAALPLQPAMLTLTPAGTIAAGTGAGGRNKGGGAGPFIFNPYAAKRQAKQEAGEANNAPDWACSDEGRVEVYLLNPLAVPLKLDQLQLHVKYLGGPGSGGTASAAGGSSASASTANLVRGGSGRQPGVGLHSNSAAASGTATPAHGGGGAVSTATAAAAAATAGKAAFKTPSLNMLLPANGRTHRVVLCGKPQLPGTYSIEGCTVTSWGVTWHVPFSAPLKKSGTTGGRSTTAGSVSGPAQSSTAAGGFAAKHLATTSGVSGNAAAAAAALAALGQGRSVCVNVLPPLPLVKAVVRAGPCNTASQLASGHSAPLGAATASVGGSGAAQQQQQQQQQQQSQVLVPGGTPHPLGAVPDPTVVAVSPRDDDIHATSAHTAFTDDLQRSPPVAVFEGQRLSWSLSLQNLGALPVTAVSVGVTNHKGVALKPLKGAPLPASFQGVHMEIDDSALQPPSPVTATAAAAAQGPASPGSTAGAMASGGDSVSIAATASGSSALPLRPGCTLMLPLVLAVGQAPRGTFREVSLELTISYLSKPADRPDTEETTSQQPQQVLGRRMTLNLTFEVQPSLSVASTAFLEHYAPLRNGQRQPLKDRPIDLRLAAAMSLASAGGAATGGVVGDGDDSDSGADGGFSRPSSLTTDFSLGNLHLHRPGSLSVASRTFLGPAGAGGPTGGGSISMQHLSSLSSRLAGLDLSMGGGGGRAGRSGPGIALHSNFRSPLSPNGAPSPWLVSPRDSQPAGTTDDLTTGAAIGPSDSFVAGGNLVSSAPSRVSGPGDDRIPALVLTRSMRSNRSAVLSAEGADDGLGLVTDSVLCVTVRNTSSYYFRAWLAHLDDASGPPPLTAAAAEAACCPIEVLQPGDSARLACVLPSAAQAALERMAQEAAASAAAAAALPSGDASGAGASGPVGSHASQLRAAFLAMSGTSLRRVGLTVQLPGGGTTDDGLEAGGIGHADAVVRQSCSGGGATAAASAAGTGSGGGATGGVGSGGGANELLAEEGDRMAAAESLAEGWAVVWELVTGLSEAAAGRAPPRGMVRLAAVDVARSMSTTAVHALRPSTIHFQFQALPPATSCGSTPPVLKDLTHRLQALGLMPPHVAGAVWGLRARLGEFFRCELLIHNRGTHAHHLIFSMAAANPSHGGGPCDPFQSSNPHQHTHGSLNTHLHHHHLHHPQMHGPAPAFQQPLHGYLHAASFQTLANAPLVVPLGASHPRPQPGAHWHPPHHQHYIQHARHPHANDGYTSGGSLTLGGAAPPLHARSGSIAAAGSAMPSGADLYGAGAWNGGAAVSEPGIDPGVVLVGAVQNVHVIVEPRSTTRHPFALTFANPGLYQLYVRDVCVLPEGADAALWAGRAGQAPQPQRVYASVDRLNVLCV